MLEEVKYQNHLGEEINFSENGIYVQSSDLHDYTWEYTEKGAKISSFQRRITNKKITLHILCDSESAGIQKRNLLMEYCDKDILAKQPGKIIVNGYYLRCYVISSSKSTFLNSKKTMSVTLGLLSDEPYWIKEVEAEYTVNGIGVVTDVTNQLGYEANFRLEFQGDTEAQTMLTIGSTVYGVRLSIASGEKLVIDSLSKEVYKLVDGEKVNVFSKRFRTFSNGALKDYVFKKIPAGSHHISRSDDFTWSMILYDERSEPKWT